MKKSFLSFKQTIRIGITALALGAFAFFSQTSDFRLWNGVDIKAETGYTISYDVSQNNLPEDIGGVRLATSRFTTLQFDGFQSGSTNYATLESSASSGFFNRHSIKGMTAITFNISSSKSDVYLTFASPGTDTVADADGIKLHASAVVLSAFPSSTSFSYTDSYYLQAYDYFFVSFPTGTDIISIEITYSCVEPESASPIAIVIEGNIGAVVGTNQSYRALVYPIGSPKGVAWSLANAYVAGSQPGGTLATIDSSTGVLTPSAVGSVIITATSSSNGSVSATFEVKICDAITQVTTITELRTALHTNNTTKYVKIMNDIDASAFTYTNSSSVFAGVLDGNGKTISSLAITGSSNIGMIGNSKGAAVYNLTFLNASVTPSGGNFSLLFASLTNGYSTIVKDVSIDNAIISNGSHTNGAFFIGNWSWNPNTNGGRLRIENSYVKGNINHSVATTPSGIGSVAGNTYFNSVQSGTGAYIQPLEIINSYFDITFGGSATNNNYNTGGLIGYNAVRFTARNVYIKVTFPSGYTNKFIDNGSIPNTGTANYSNVLAICSNSTTTRILATVLSTQANITTTHTNPFINAVRTPWSVNLDDSTKLQLSVNGIKYPA